MRFPTRFIALLLPLLATGAAAAWAQGYSSLQGTVTDPSGAVVPGASIELRNPATEASISATANEAGFYRLPQVPPGAYRLLAQARGFAQIGIAEVVLPVNQPVTVDIQFKEVGAVSEVISVRAETAQVNVVDASLGHAVGTRPILELPFEARNVVALLSLQPGVAYVRDTPVYYAEDTRSGAVNGGKSDQANITLDGVDVNDQQDGHAFQSALRVTLDSVQEFRTTTLNATADQGRSSGAQVAMVTRSGTNDFHGSAYWYHRNTATTANSFFNNAVPPSEFYPQGGIPRARLIRNIYGGALGGPVRNNRLFFFYNYEGRKDRSEENVVRAVPSAELRQGIVRYINTSGGVTSLAPADIRSIIDPLGLGPNPNSLAYFNRFPMPNDDTQGDGLNVRGFRFLSPVRLDWHTHITRWDYYADPNARHQLFFRANYQDDDEISAEQFPGSGPRYRNLTGSRGLAAGLASTLSPTVFNSLRYGYTRQKVDTGGASSASQLTFRTLDDLCPETRSLIRIIPVHNFADDLSLIRGNHTVKVGASIRWIDNHRTNWEESFHTGSLNSSWLYGSGAELDEPLADLSSNFRTAYRDAMALTLGLVTEVDARYNYNRDGSLKPLGEAVEREFAQGSYEMYAMDTWRVTRALTVTAGLRWSLNPPIHEANGLQTSALPSLGEWFNLRGGLMRQGRSQAEAGEIRATLAGEPGGRPMYPYHKKNFAPRLSIAYSPQASSGFWGKLLGGPGRTSVRAGFGIFYDNFGQGLMRLADSTSLGLTTTITNPSYVLGAGDAPRFTGVFDIPPELLQPAPPGGFPQTAPRVFAITNGVDDTIKPPYSMALNFSIGRELPHGFFIEASYAGRLSRRSLIQRDLAMPADIVDPASGQSYFQAAKALAVLAREGVDVEDIQPAPFFENMFPALAGGGWTATQTAYDFIAWAAPDYTYALYLWDVLEYPAPSRLGPYAFFNEQYSALAAWSSIAGGNYHGGQLTLRKRFSDGIQFDFNYTLSKSIDLASNAERVGAFDGFLVNSWSPHQLKAVSDYDTRHQLNASWVVELPFGRGRKWGGRWSPVLDRILGGWQVSGLWRQTSGLTASVFNGRQWPTNWNITGYASQTGSTPEQGVFKNAKAVAGNPGPNIFKDPAAAIESWSPSLPGESGQRNGVRGDGYFTIDMGLAKRFSLPWEGHSMQFRWEVFNGTNSVRFDPYGTSLTLSDVGSFGKYQDLLTNPRVMQFALRYEF